MYGLRQDQIEAINNCFAKYPGIDQVILYGSRAKGNYKSGSDIDLVIIDHNLSFSELVKLENEIDDLLLPYIIDLSLKRKIENADLIDHIDRIGKVFYDKVHQSILNEPPAKKADEI